MFKAVLNWLSGSFDNFPSGASSKKLSAFWAIVFMATPVQFTWLVWAYRHDDFIMLPEVLFIDLGFAATALGISSFEKIKKKPNDDQSNQ